MSTLSGNCEDGDIRLEGGVDNDQTRTRDGRIEICFNNAWGTVCNTAFSLLDAIVTCHQLTGFKKEGVWCIIIKCAVQFLFCLGARLLDTRPLMSSSGPIYLDQLLCSEEDDSLQGCNWGIRAFGLTTCNHSSDAWVECSG